MLNRVETLSEEEWTALKKTRPELLKALEVLAEPKMSPKAKRAFENAGHKFKKAAPKKSSPKKTEAKAEAAPKKTATKKTTSKG